MGVFWRILFIETVLLVYSLGYRWLAEGAGPMELFWYTIRIMVLVGIIVVFMVVSLKHFLTRKIIDPLEQITVANRQIETDFSKADTIDLPADTPDEIKAIVSTRAAMLERIIRVSDQRLQLVRFIKIPSAGIFPKSGGRNPLLRQRPADRGLPENRHRAYG